MVLDTRDTEDSSTMFRFSVSTHKKKWCAFEKFSQKFFQTKKIFIFIFASLGGGKGGGGQKHVNIVLGRSHNSFDALNWTINQKNKFSPFLIILALWGGDGGKGGPKG